MFHYFSKHTLFCFALEEFIFNIGTSDYAIIECPLHDSVDVISTCIQCAPDLVYKIIEFKHINTVQPAISYDNTFHTIS